MPKVLKVALDGYNAETDTEPAHFSLYVDGTLEHVLLKEKARGTQSVTASSTASISHALGYYPSTFAFVERSAGEFAWVHNDFSALFDTDHPFYSYVTTSNLVAGNNDASDKTFTYIIFHDQL